MSGAYTMAAVDLGASSGRMILGEYDGRKLRFVDEYRMENGFVNLDGSLYWNVLGLYQNIVRGFRYFKNKGVDIKSIGVNTWGVDVVFLDKWGHPVAFPRCYRDARNRQAFEEVSKKITPRDFYGRTGILPDPINSVYQICAAARDPVWECTDSFLFLPDFFCYLMTGNRATETSIASTSQMLNRLTGEFDSGIREQLGLTKLKCPPVLKSFGERGRFTGHFAEQTGYGDVKVMNINSHDTGSAIALADALPGSELLMNSGTIAIFSAIRDEPLVSGESYRCGITNESVLDGRFRPAVNLSGLFFINQCREWWALEGKTYTWADITEMASAAKPCLGLLDLRSPELQSGGNMPDMIRKQCRKRGIHVPRDDGETARMVYESMAALFAESMAKYERAAGCRYDCINVVGGGSKNGLLNQMIADASRKTVKTGTAEATALGNMLAQLEGTGELGHGDMLELMAESFDGPVFEPGAGR